MALHPDRRPRLVLAITLVLVVKFLALAIIWDVWFSTPESRYVDAERVGTTIYSAPVAVHNGREAHARP